MYVNFFAIAYNFSYSPRVHALLVLIFFSSFFKLSVYLLPSLDLHLYLYLNSFCFFLSLHHGSCSIKILLSCQICFLSTFSFFYTCQCSTNCFPFTPFVFSCSPAFLLFLSSFFLDRSPYLCFYFANSFLGLSCSPPLFSCKYSHPQYSYLNLSFLSNFFSSYLLLISLSYLSYNFFLSCTHSPFMISILLSFKTLFLTYTFNFR